MWEDITFPFPNFNGCTVEVWEWISNFISHFTEHVITYPCLGLKLNYVSKRSPGVAIELSRDRVIFPYLCLFLCEKCTFHYEQPLDMSYTIFVWTIYLGICFKRSQIYNNTMYESKC